MSRVPGYATVVEGERNHNSSPPTYQSGPQPHREPMGTAQISYIWNRG